MSDQLNETNLEVWKNIVVRCTDLLSILRPRLLDFCKQEDKNGKSLTLMDLMRRVECNIRTVSVLATLSVKTNGSVYYKLPVGLLVRNCLMDCLTGLYIRQKKDDACSNMMELRNRDYVKALFEEFEVYKDKVSFLKLDDVFLEHIYTMSLEDTFLSELNINENAQIIEPMKERFIWKARNPKDIYADYKKADGQLKSMKDELSNDSVIAGCINNLYAYYKYFSQYEHYSERGYGDCLANFGEDNISFEKVFDYIEKSVQLIV